MDAYPSGRIFERGAYSRKVLNQAMALLLLLVDGGIFMIDDKDHMLSIKNLISVLKIMDT